MIQLATAATAAYPWLPAFVASLKRHCNVPFRVFEPGKDVPYPRVRGEMLQHGAFIKHLPPLTADDVLLFVDADMIMQRPFTPEEIEWFHRLQPDEICVGLNGPRGETLLDEAALLEPQVEGWVLDSLFPGWQPLPAWNTGFVAARRSAYQRLYDMSRALMPAAESCFAHYAAVQWVMCYCIGRFLKHVELPQTIHLHGCWGKPEGHSWSETGEAKFNGELAAFRHAMNLTPPKGLNYVP